MAYDNKVDAIIVIGDITSAKDLEDSFRMDNNRVSFLTIAFVFIVLLFTFRSLGAAVLLMQNKKKRA